MADLKNAVPESGARITLTIHDDGISVIEVVGRNLVKHLDEAQIWSGRLERYGVGARRKSGVRRLARTGDLIDFKRVRGLSSI